MRASRRLRRRLLEPSARESRIFFTPALVAGGIAVLWIYISLLALGGTHLGDPSAGFLTWCFFAGEAAGFSIRTLYLVIVVSLALNFSVVLLGWLVEVHRDKWDAYLPWRMTSGLWAACILALVAVLGAAVMRTPGPKTLVAFADRAFAGGNSVPCFLALRHRVPGTERALRNHLKDAEVGARFEAAVVLRVVVGRDESTDRAMREGVEELAVSVSTHLPTEAVDPLRARLVAGFRRLGDELPTAIVAEAAHLAGEAFTDDAEFFRWWRLHERLLFP